MASQLVASLPAGPILRLPFVSLRSIPSPMCRGGEGLQNHNPSPLQASYCGCHFFLSGRFRHLNRGGARGARNHSYNEFKVGTQHSARPCQLPILPQAPYCGCLFFLSGQFRQRLRPPESENPSFLRRTGCDYIAAALTAAVAGACVDLMHGIAILDQFSNVTEITPA
jgi:hypothetical protein